MSQKPLRFEDHGYDKTLLILGRRFPVLKDAPLEPWDANKLDRWACAGCTDSTRHAVQFLLSLALPRATHFKIGRFDVVQAFLKWDEKNRAAFLSWAQHPTYNP